MTKFFKYIPEENRYVLEERGEGDALTSDFPRVFDQKGVLHTTEDLPVNLARSYNLEQSVAINDAALEAGAEARGQKLGDISPDGHLKDNPPEAGY